MKAITSGGGGGGTVSIAGKKRKVYSGAKKAVSRFTIPRGPVLRTNGEYKLTRAGYLTVPYGSSGFQVGGAPFQGVGLVFYPGGIALVTTLLGPLINALIPNYAELAAVWDRIKIEKVVLEMNTDRTDPAAGVVGTGSTPIIYYASDKTDIYANTLDITQQQQNVKSFQSTSNLYNTITTVYPYYQRVIYYTAALSSYEPARGYVVSNTEIPHYGLRLAMPTGGVVGGGNMSIRFTYHYCCKDVK